MARTVVWVVAVVVGVIPVAYFLLHLGDSAFMSGAMGNWFATMLGVVFGIPVGIDLSRRQQAYVDRQQIEARNRDAAVLAGKYIHLVGVEFLVNRDAVKRLETVLAQSSSARSDTWSWACRIAEGFSFSAFERLQNAAIIAPWHSDVETFAVYMWHLRIVANAVREGAAEHDFCYGYLGSSDLANEALARTRQAVTSLGKELDAAAAAWERLNVAYPTGA